LLGIRKAFLYVTIGINLWFTRNLMQINHLFFVWDICYDVRYNYFSEKM